MVVARPTVHTRRQLLTCNVTSGSSFGTGCRRLFQVQYRLNPQWCQRMTVSGFTMTRTLSQSVQILRNSTQNPRSAFESRGRFTGTAEDG